MTAHEQFVRRQVERIHEVDAALDEALRWAVARATSPEEQKHHLHCANQLAQLRHTLLLTQFEGSRERRTVVFRPDPRCRMPSICVTHGGCQDDPRCDGTAVVGR